MQQFQSQSNMVKFASFEEFSGILHQLETSNSGFGHKESPNKRMDGNL